MSDDRSPTTSPRLLQGLRDVADRIDAMSPEELRHLLDEAEGGFITAFAEDLAEMGYVPSWARPVEEREAAKAAGPDCNVPGCPRSCPPNGVFCKLHWQRLPRRLRRRLCSLWSKGLGASRAYAWTVAEAVRWSVGRVEYPAAAAANARREEP